MARKKAEDAPPPGCPAWLATYGDMVTLVLTFFVLLFSFSEIDKTKLMEFVTSFQSSTGVLDGGSGIIGPGGEVDLPPVDPGDEENEPADPADPGHTADPDHVANPNAGDMDVVLEAIDKWYAEVTEQPGANLNIEIERHEYEIIVRLPGNVLFDSGFAVLKNEAKDLLLSFFEYINTVQGLETLQTIRVEGHTDSVPMSGRYRDNQDLSVARADTVLRYLWDTVPEIPRHLYSSAGFGEYRPIDDNETEYGRARNRRVDFVLVWPFPGVR